MGRCELVATDLAPHRRDVGLLRRKQPIHQGKITMRPAFARLSYSIGVLCGVALAASAATACDSPPQTGDPFIAEASILTPTVNVGKPPGQPAIEVTFRTGPSGLHYIEYQLQGPSPSNQFVYSYAYFENGLTSGRTEIQAFYTAPQQSLNVYSAPGTWTLSGLAIGDNDGNCTSYGSAALTKLVPHATIEVVNTGTPDTEAPKITGAKILTPTVSRSAANAWVRVNLAVTDNLSGVAYAVAQFDTAGSNNLNTDANTTYPVRDGVVTTAASIDASTVKGTYKVYQLYVCDYAYNCVTIDKPSTLYTLFGGKTTFQITE